MTWKLIKFEFRSSFRILLVLWAAFLAISIIICISGSAPGFEDKFTGTYTTGGSNLYNILSFIGVMAYFAILISIGVLTIVVIILRFYRGLLGDEGYLMHTLPVREWQLITAKGVVATCAVIGSSIVTLISFLMILSAAADVTLGYVIRDIFDTVKYNPTYVLFLVETLVVMFLGIMKSVYQVYAALSIGQLVNRHRILVSLGAYIGISIILAIIAGAFLSTSATLVSSILPGGWLYSLSFSTADGITQSSQMFFLFTALITGVQLAAFHIVTERILTKKLNLL